MAASVSSATAIEVVALLFSGTSFWIDTVGRSSLIEIRIEIPGGVMRVIARRSQTFIL